MRGSCLEALCEKSGEGKQALLMRKEADSILERCDQVPHPPSLSCIFFIVTYITHTYCACQYTYIYIVFSRLCCP